MKTFWPGYHEAFTKIGRERGWPPVTRPQFDVATSPSGALLVGGLEAVAAKMIAAHEALGGVSRFSGLLDNRRLTHAQLMRASELLRTRVAAVVRQAIAPAATMSAA